MALEKVNIEKANKPYLANETRKLFNYILETIYWQNLPNHCHSFVALTFPNKLYHARNRHIISIRESECRVFFFYIQIVLNENFIDVVLFCIE